MFGGTPPKLDSVARLEIKPAMGRGGNNGSAVGGKLGLVLPEEEQELVQRAWRARMARKHAR